MSAEEERDRIRTNVMAAANDGDIAALINAMSVLSHLEPCCKFDFIVDPMFQDTPLMITANNGHLECLRLLLNSNASVLAVDADGNTPLHLACQQNKIDCARLLLEHKAEVDALNKDGDTCLLKTADDDIEDDTECVMLLLEHGANATHRNNAGKTAVEVASEFKQAGVVRLLKRHTIAQANWAVLAPMLACHVAHATDKLPPITHHLVTVNIVNDKSANTDSCSAECEVLPVTNPTLQNVNSSKVIPLFTTSIDDLLPIIRSYGDFSVQSDYEGGSAKCNSFLSSSFAQDVLGLVADCQ